MNDIRAGLGTSPCAIEDIHRLAVALFSESRAVTLQQALELAVDRMATAPDRAGDPH